MLLAMTMPAIWAPLRWPRPNARRTARSTTMTIAMTAITKSTTRRVDIFRTWL